MQATVATLMFYLQGYELRLGNGENDKGDWEVQKNVKGTEAYRQWKRSKPAYFHQLLFNDKGAVGNIPIGTPLAQCMLNC
eukprot:882613-Pelagomonas_calceolata.AAC.4